MAESSSNASAYLITAVICIRIFPSVIAFRSRNEGVRLAGPNQAMAFYNMLFVYGTLLGVLFLGETLTWSNLLGGISVIGGGLLSALGDQSRKHAQEKTVT